MTSPRICSIDGCTQPHKGRGLCSKHHSRLFRHGDPLDPGREARDLTAKARFLLYVPLERTPGECWIWEGVTKATGYGLFSISEMGRRRTGHAHRFAYEFFIGAIPQGMELDHLCRTRSCVNPAHLEPVTHAENVRRSFAARKRGLTAERESA